jgi:hypothetical protein
LADRKKELQKEAKAAMLREAEKFKAMKVPTLTPIACLLSAVCCLLREAEEFKAMEIPTPIIPMSKPSCLPLAYLMVHRLSAVRYPFSGDCSLICCP